MTTPFQSARDRLKPHGINLTQCGGEYRVNHRQGSPATDYVTDDLQDALQHGLEIAKQPAPPPRRKPLGPLGSPTRAKRRAKMYLHNNILLANWEKEKEAEIEAEITATIKRKK